MFAAFKTWKISHKIEEIKASMMYKRVWIIHITMQEAMKTLTSCMVICIIQTRF
jgi:hypothetical protein